MDSYFIGIPEGFDFSLVVFPEDSPPEATSILAFITGQINTINLHGNILHCSLSDISPIGGLLIREVDRAIVDLYFEQLTEWCRLNGASLMTRNEARTFIEIHTPEFE